MNGEASWIYNPHPCPGQRVDASAGIQGGFSLGVQLIGMACLYMREESLKNSSERLVTVRTAAENTSREPLEDLRASQLQPNRKIRQCEYEARTIELATSTASTSTHWSGPCVKEMFIS